MALLTVTAMLFAAPGVAFAQDDTNDTTDGNATATPTATPTPVENETDDNGTDANASVSPGERLSAVVGVEEEELEGELGSRAFGLAVARAASNDSQLGDVVAEEYNETNETIREIEQRREALNESRANGSISEGQYQARMTVLTAQARTAQQQANATANASEGLPTELLEEKGINASNVQRLKQDAANLTGPEVAEIARNIAGEGVGANMAEDRGQAEDRGDREDMNRSDGNETDGDTNRSDGMDQSDGQDGSQNRSDGDGTDEETNETDDDGADTRDGN